MLAQKLEELVTHQEAMMSGNFVIPGSDGKTARDVIGEHKLLFSNQEEISKKLDRTIETLEGKPILSEITQEIVGYELGISGKITEVYDAFNGGAPIRVMRKWTPEQRWVWGLAIGIGLAIMIALIPIVWDVVQTGSS